MVWYVNGMLSNYPVICTNFSLVFDAMQVWMLKLIFWRRNLVVFIQVGKWTSLFAWMQLC